VDRAALIATRGGPPFPNRKARPPGGDAAAARACVREREQQALNGMNERH
jgi:hypothetical protein